MAEFRMPSLGADMTAGTLLEWLVAPGAVVHRGDVVAVVDTDKAAIEVECFDEGVVDRLLVQPGEQVPVGAVLATIAPAVTQTTAVTPIPAVTPVPAVTPIPAATLAPAVTPTPAVPSPAPPLSATVPATPARPNGGRPARRAGRKRPSARPVTGPPAPAAPPSPPVLPAQPLPKASPPVRQLAAGLGVDLGRLTGTGRGGRITRADVERAAAGRHPAAASPVVPAAAPPLVTTPPLVTARPSPATVPGRPDGVRASPLARRLAGEAGLDLAGVTGTGPGGAVRAADIRQALSARPAPPPVAAPAAPVPVPPTARAEPIGAAQRRPDAAEAMRRAIATLMSRSNREIPHYYLTATIDMSTASAWLRARNRELPVHDRLVPAALLLKATARAAARVEELNGTWTHDAFHPSAAVHLGMIISLRSGGLAAPVIHDAAELPLPELMTRLRDLAARARTGRLRSSELVGATITVSNLGDQGVDTVLGVIHPPQVALVGFGAVAERPWAVNGLLGVRPVVTASLSADHRATDGAVGARFLHVLDRLLQQPEEL